MIKLTNRMLVAAMVLAASVSVAQASSSKVKTSLAPTGSAPEAKGKASAVVRNATKGRFEVKVQKLAPNTSYDVVVGGMKVTTITTKNNGSAKVRFSSAPKNDDVLLGFDPRGAAVEVRGASGDDVLTGNLPADPNDVDGSDVACCIPDDSGTECEDRAEAECIAQGGTVTGATSCLPNPCGETPPADLDVVCCLPDDSGVECEDRTAAECDAQGGINKGAGMCTATSCDRL